MCNYWSLCVILLSLVPNLTHQFSIRSRDVTDAHIDDTALRDDVMGLRRDVTRKEQQTRPGHKEDGDVIRRSISSQRSSAFESSLNDLYSRYLQMVDPSVRVNPNTAGALAAWREAATGSSRRHHRVTFGDDLMKPEVDEGQAANPVKRYYYRRQCNINQLSRQAFVELIKTGKLCGRRVAAIRFGLTGR